MGERKELKVKKCPVEALALRNVVAINPDEFAGSVSYIRIRNQYAPAGLVFSVEKSEAITKGSIGFSGAQRIWAKLADGDMVSVAVEKFTVHQYVGTISIDIEFQKKKFVTKERYKVTDLAKEFQLTFNQQAFSTGQTFVFKYMRQDEPMFKCTVKAMTSVKMGAGDEDDVDGGKEVHEGVVTASTQMLFTSTAVSLAGSATSVEKKSIFDPGWKFDDMGIGGLGGQFREMFRRAFVSRIFPADVVEKLGIQHTKGMMLFGPPGTGKTLMARKIGNMLQGREPKIVNGPEIMSKYVGESEENVRKLFADAEKEQMERGENSSLHIIIFDEIDAICKQRGSTSGGTGVADSVVNQLLSKIDGVEALNNVFLIGMTNRLDMIDEALLRPGRFELKLQIGLPDEAGRLEIFKIHTKKLLVNNYLTDTVNLSDLAARSKNFSGAEIAGLVRSAVSFATERCMQGGNSTAVDAKAIATLKVGPADFDRALSEVKPAFGTDDDQFEASTPNGIVEWDVQVDVTLQTGKLLVQQLQNSTRTQLVSMLLSGGSATGKTALACRIAQDSGFPYVKMISPEKFVGMSETAKVSRITKIFEDAYKSKFSAVVVDDIERLIDYNEIGYRFSNVVLQALLVLIKKAPPHGFKLMVIATTNQYDILNKMQVVQQFSKVQHLNEVERVDQVMTVLHDLTPTFNDKVMGEIKAALSAESGNKFNYQGFGEVQLSIGIKKLYAVAEMALQSDDPGDTFLYSLYEECKARRY
eukprot:m.1637665 g.1637665  ORF g.1637665 m.1637665 type:complete len:754 (+) comp26004_c0_seq1:96-2357(+)